MPPSETSARIRAFDWLRGVAVLFMIQCHAMTLLRPELRQGPGFQFLSWLDGLVAPSFIFSSGFFLAMVQVRSAVGDRSQRWKRIRKTLRRIFEVLAVAMLVNWMWFPIFREPKWIVRLDILHCIGLGLLLALPLLAGLATRPRALTAATFLIALVFFGYAPLAEQVRGPWAALANSSGDTVFPLFPWTGYVFLGASAGAMAGTGNYRRVVIWICVLGVVGLALWQAAPFFRALYPPHRFFTTNPSNQGHRWTYVMAFLLVLMALEHKFAGKWIRSAPVRVVEVFGGSSLAAYFFHLMFLYFELFGLGFSFNAWWGNRCGWSQYWLLTAILCALTWIFCLLTDRIYRRVERRLEHKGTHQGGSPTPAA